MIIINKKIFFPVLALAIIGAGLVKTNFVSAQEGSGPESLITAIAQKFNLNQNDVKAVFDQEKSKRETQRKSQMDQKLTQAVTDGKITETQKQAIIAKFSSMQKPDMASFKSMTPDQRKAQMDQKRTDLDNWASQNGISLDTLKSLIGGPRGHIRGMMGGK